MVDPAPTAAAAFAVGLATSLHCAGMCGPIACSLLSLQGPHADPQTTAALYHTGRLLSYASLGTLAGALGHWPLASLTHSPAMVLPWLLAAILLAIACGFHPTFPRPAFLQKWALRTRLSLRHLPPKPSALALGLATPLLPCGPLYLMLALALASGSALRGLECMLAFALGTTPLLWFAQHQFHLWKNRLAPQSMARLRRSIAAAGALLVVARLWSQPPLPTDQSAPTATCPLCHGP